MKRITIESFFTTETDLELIQYKILGGIREASKDFYKKKIYPALSTLIDLRKSIDKIKHEKNNVCSNFPKQIIGFDFKEKKVIYDHPENIKLNNNVEDVFSLLDWAIPFINDAIEEGIVLFDYVDKNIKLEQVGILPMYKDEGYFMIADNTSCQLQIHRYECTIFSSGEENFRALKTEFIKSEKHGIIKKQPESIKHDLIEERKDLPNPATFLFDSDLDFPFTETIFPVVKRKLILHIAA